MWWISPPEERTRWHLWFAWHPVTVSTYPDGAGKVVWLEYVLRCGKCELGMEGVYWNWEYKEVTHAPNNPDR